MKRLLATAALALSLSTAANAQYFTVPSGVSEGRMNMRNGPGANHALVGAIPEGGTVVAQRCTPRDDGTRGADWCLVEYNGVRGWVSRAGLMPVEAPAYRGVPIPPQTQMVVPTPRAFDTTPQLPGWYLFKCLPAPDPTDRNPPVTAWVSINLAPDNRLLDMSVDYNLYDGSTVSRTQQYAAVIGNDGPVYGWTGNYVRDPSKRMSGGLFFATDGRWYYREKLWDHNRVDLDQTLPCGVADPSIQ